jgi:hypothetical protein
MTATTTVGRRRSDVCRDGILFSTTSAAIATSLAMDARKAAKRRSWACTVGVMVPAAAAAVVTTD